MTAYGTKVWTIAIYEPQHWTKRECSQSEVRVNSEYGHKEGVFMVQGDYPRPVTLYNVGE